MRYHIKSNYWLEVNKGARKTAINDLTWNKKELKALKTKSAQIKNQEENILFSESEKRMIDIKRLEKKIQQQIKEIENYDKVINDLESKIKPKKKITELKFE